MSELLDSILRLILVLFLCSFVFFFMNSCVEGLNAEGEHNRSVKCFELTKSNRCFKEFKSKPKTEVSE
jgi:hypothetical protein